MSDGFINVLKPPGMSSGAVVSAIKRVTRSKAGHAGTLDPEAAGVLPVMVGRATRLFDYIVDKQKTYLAEIAFGCATDTQDAQGCVIQRGERYPAFAEIQAVLPQFVGEIWQTPPAFSALKRGGTPLYKLARKGETPDIQPRPITVFGMDALRETAGHGCLIRVRCGRGTYIRTLCHDIGQALGCPAHMRFLLREQTGVFNLQTAVTLEQTRVYFEQISAELKQTKVYYDNDIEKSKQTRVQYDKNVTHSKQTIVHSEQTKVYYPATVCVLLPMDAPLHHLPRVDIPAPLEKACRNGRPIPADAVPPGEMGESIRVYAGNQFIGIWLRQGNQLLPRVVLTDGSNR